MTEAAAGLRRFASIGLSAAALTGCAVHVIEPANFQTAVPVPVVAVVSLPLFYDGRFAARINDRDVTPAFQLDPSRLVMTASLPLPNGLYWLEASGCWSFNAFIPLGGCSVSSARFEIGKGLDSYLQVRDSGTGNEAFVVNLRLNCRGTTLTVKRTDSGRSGGTIFSGTFSYPVLRVRGLERDLDYSFVASGCGKSETVVAHLSIAPPPDAGQVDRLLFVLPTTYTLNYPDYIDRIQFRLDNVNTIYRQSGIQKQFTIGSIKTYDDLSPSCPKSTINDPCDVHYDPQYYAPDMTTVFHVYTLPGGYGISATPWLRIIDFVISPANPRQDFYLRDGPDFLSTANTAATLAHELAHEYSAGAPEYYFHLVVDKTGVEPLFVATEGPSLFGYLGAIPARYFYDPLFGVLPFPPLEPVASVQFGPLSRAIINDNTAFTVGANDFYTYYRQNHPDAVALTVRDATERPLAGASVDYYCLTRWMGGDISETTPRARAVTDIDGKARFAAPLPFDTTACNVMGLKLTKAGYVPTLRTVTSVELEEAAFVDRHRDDYAVAVKMPRDVDSAVLDCSDPDRRVAVSARTETSVDLEWCQDRAATRYEVLLRREGIAEGGDAYLFTDGTSAKATRLVKGSRYHLYIAPRRKNCSDCLPVSPVIESIVRTAP